MGVQTLAHNQHGGAEDVAGAGGSRLGLDRAQLVEALAQPLPQTESNFAQPQ